MKKKNKTCLSIIQNFPPDRKVLRESSDRQLELFPVLSKPQKHQASNIPLSGKIAQQQAIFQKPRKPQIESIPGVSPKRRDRYQVTVGDKAIASELTCDD